MNLCYLCGREMFDEKVYLKDKDKFSEEPALKHKEHIIQNALIGRLKPNNILCKACGNKLNDTIDINFVNIFASITEILQKKNVQKERKNNSPELKGHFLNKETQEKINIIIKDLKASPVKPYYKVDYENKIIKIYANESIAKNYKNKVVSEVKNQINDIQLYEIKYITDISSENGSLFLYFTEGIDNCNEKLCLGLNKIATGFAYHHGVRRTDLVRSLDITQDNEKIIYSKNVIPFFPIGCFDIFLELNRPELESYYPTHTLILFTQKYTNDKKLLYCYIDLFSTFQFYVLLNENYEGDDIHKEYYQTVLGQELPEIEIRKIRPKFLNVIIENFKIDRSKYKGSSTNDLYDFVEEEYKKIQLKSQINIDDILVNIANDLMICYSVSQVSKLSSLPNFPLKDVINSFRNFKSLHLQCFLSEIKHYLDKNNYIFRRYFYDDDGNDEVEILSTPDEIIASYKKNELPIKAYGYRKFQQLQSFANSTPKEDILHTLYQKKLYSQPIIEVSEKHFEQVDIIDTNECF
ncbi:hypothetical protein CDG76_17155 [Nostoc sp. 'Peltigera membranacea cyanobiont' 210A]|uniref:HNH endonuclease n=1 Tax=Nostoc sp. 'Peltigera membranacea cyanobiont' 210A TaxID=2014529 RepID=UPI000B95126A|nr:HNH endonuclease [Nostoc sp. 'Peltigera membranacea cyanobiont' 210A]OYD93715.1 hypothetical protein CDG76_17155 [Nostoc sp. 'Peltigera membranacea cyanobiont' 210A]